MQETPMGDAPAMDTMPMPTKSGKAKKMLVAGLFIAVVIIIIQFVVIVALLGREPTTTTSDTSQETGDNEVVELFDADGYRLVSEECPQVTFPAGDPEPFNRHLDFSIDFNTCAWELSESTAPNPNAGGDLIVPSNEVITLTHKEDPDTTLVFNLETIAGGIGFGPVCGDGDFEVLDGDEDYFKLGRYVNDDGDWAYLPSFSTEDLMGGDEEYCYSGPFATLRNAPDPQSTNVYPQSLDTIIPVGDRAVSLFEPVFSGDENLVKDADLVILSMNTESQSATEGNEPVVVAPVAGDDTSGETQRVRIEGTILTFVLPVQDTYARNDISNLPTTEANKVRDMEKQWYIHFTDDIPDLPSIFPHETTVTIGYSPDRAVGYPGNPHSFGDSYFSIDTDYDAQGSLDTLAQQFISDYEAFEYEVTSEQTTVGPFTAYKFTYGDSFMDYVQYMFQSAEGTHYVGIHPHDTEVLDEVLNSVAQEVE